MPHQIQDGLVCGGLVAARRVVPRCAGRPRTMIETSAAGRVGTADEVATAAFLLGPDAGSITGTDLLVDGGVIAALRAGRWQLAL